MKSVNCYINGQIYKVDKIIQTIPEAILKKIPIAFAGGLGILVSGSDLFLPPNEEIRIVMDSKFVFGLPIGNVGPSVFIALKPGFLPLKNRNYFRIPLVVGLDIGEARTATNNIGGGGVAFIPVNIATGTIVPVRFRLPDNYEFFSLARMLMNDAALFVDLKEKYRDELIAHLYKLKTKIIERTPVLT